MSTSYFFKLDNLSNNYKEKDLLNEFYLSGSNVLYSDILSSKFSNFNTYKEDYYNIIDNKDFDLIENEIKIEINNSYQSLIKKVLVIFMAKLDGVDEKKFNKLEKNLKISLSKFEKILNTLINDIYLFLEDKKNFYFNIVLLNSLLIELNSEKILQKSEEKLYKEYGFFQEFIKNNSNLEEEINNSINKYLLDKKEDIYNMLSQIVFLQDIFLEYNNNYIEKEYISEELFYFYDKINDLLKLLLFVRIGNVLKIDIIYG